MSVSKSAFFPAVDLLRADLGCLDKVRRWRDHYELTLSLSSLAESEFRIGNHDQATIAVQEVLENTKELKDKFRAQSVMLKSVTESKDRDFHKILETTLDILKLYKIQLPQRPSRVHLFWANH